jgi:hypothetical protein
MQLVALERLPQTLATRASSVLSEDDLTDVFVELGLEQQPSVSFAGDLMYFVRSWLDYVAETSNSNPTDKVNIESILESLDISTETQDARKIEALTKITESPAVLAIAKARYLYTIGGNVFVSARAISSITPIFKDIIDTGFESIGYFTASRIRLQFWGAQSNLEELHIDLTSEDVASLIATLKRTQKKTDELQKLATPKQPMVKI